MRRGALLVFDALSGSGPLIIGVFYLHKFRHIISLIHDYCWRIDAGHNQLDVMFTFFNEFQHLLFLKNIENYGIQYFVANEQVSSSFNGLKCKA